MRAFVVLLALLVACVMCRSPPNPCAKPTKKFVNKCLKKGYQPKSLSDCDTTDGDLKKRRLRKCTRLENTIVEQSCEVAECTPKPVVEPTQAPSAWCEHQNSFLYSYAGPSFDNLEAAQAACLANSKCNGITQVL